MHKETLLRTQVIGGDERDRGLTSQVALLSSQSFCINQLNKSTGARTGGLGHLLTFISYRLESCFRQVACGQCNGGVRHMGCKIQIKMKLYFYLRTCFSLHLEVVAIYKMGNLRLSLEKTCVAKCI